MLLSARRIYPRQHPARKAAWVSAMFMLIEAVLGAVLVLYGWVDQSIAFERVLVLGLHLINTFFLIATIALACFYARYPFLTTVRWPRRERPWLGFGLGLLSAAGVFGVIAALASMMHPAESFVQGMRADFSDSSPWIVRIRILHPFLSVAAGIFLVWYALRESAIAQGTAVARYVICLVALQMVLGPLTLMVGASVPLKLLHLLVADLLVISFVILWTERSQEVIAGQKGQAPRASAGNKEQLACG
jgi:cytochrome c oxidase assembly protein subunit 15